MGDERTELDKAIDGLVESEMLYTKAVVLVSLGFIGLAIILTIVVAIATSGYGASP